MYEELTIVKMKPSEVVHDLELAAYAIEDGDPELLMRVRGAIKRIVTAVSVDAAPTPAPVATEVVAQDDHSEHSLDMVAQGGGVDVEKVMALVDEYAVLLRREFTATIGSVRRFREGEAEEKRSEIRALLASASAVLVGDGWMPIETAPTDTEILIGAFIDGEWHWGRSVRFYESANEFEGETFSGWVWSIDDVSESVAESPTHWRNQPLPPAPIRRWGGLRDGQA